jgi:hypothetical protein
VIADTRENTVGVDRHVEFLVDKKVVVRARPMNRKLLMNVAMKGNAAPK